MTEASHGQALVVGSIPIQEKFYIISSLWQQSKAQRFDPRLDTQQFQELGRNW